MIVRLRGTLVDVQNNRITIECAGVGYEVAIPQSCLGQLPPVGEEFLLFTRQIFREDDQFLVGFTDPFDRTMFDLLTEVKGCGPKVSLTILGDLGSEETLEAIATEDARRLSKASGVGPRMAERIIVELKEKVRQESLVRTIQRGPGTRQAVASLPDDELVEALLALGYRRSEAESAASEVGISSGTVEERLRLALRHLSR